MLIAQIVHAKVTAITFIMMIARYCLGCIKGCSLWAVVKQHNLMPVSHAGELFRLMLFNMLAPVNLSQKRWSVQ